MKQIISLYCGAGGIDEGLKQAGLTTTLAIDFDNDSCRTLKINHPDCEVIIGKVGDLIESLPKKAFAVVGGPPCPEFSRANSQRSFDMCEVNNFLKIVDEVKPQYYLMENVQDVKKKLFKGSYLINSADYGVPQIRHRRFFTNIPLPEPTHAENPQNTLSGKSMQKWVSVKKALGLTNGIIEDRKITYGKTEYRKYSTDRPSPTEHTDTRFWLVSELEKKNPAMFKRHKPRGIDVPIVTIVGKDYGPHSHASLITDGTIARKLTNEELAILQGFPTNYKFFGGKTSVRRQIGNAVPPPVIKAFFSQLQVNTLAAF